MLPAQGLSLQPSAESLLTLEVMPQVLGAVLSELMPPKKHKADDCSSQQLRAWEPVHSCYLDPADSDGVSCLHVR